MKIDFFEKHKGTEMKIIIMMIILINQIAFSSESDWVLEKDDDNIQIYTRQANGSNIKEFKATTIINRPVRELVEIIKDIPNYPKWMFHTKISKILKTENSNEMYYYFEVNVPWPFENRDDVLHFKLTEDAETKAITVNLTGNPDYIEKKEGIVRISQEHGMWKFTPKGNRTEIIYKFAADPSGNIPTFIINMFLVDDPFNTLTNLRDYRMEK
jgi:uncharacterized membrane protein